MALKAQGRFGAIESGQTLHSAQLASCVMQEPLLLAKQRAEAGSIRIDFKRDDVDGIGRHNFDKENLAVEGKFRKIKIRGWIPT